MERAEYIDGNRDLCWGYFPRNLLLKSRFMVKIPQLTMIGAAMQKTIMALSLSSSPRIEDAVRTQNRIFWGYIIVSALVLLGTILLFRSSGRVQDAIKSDADARIAEANRQIKQVESDANERIKQSEANAKIRIEQIESERAAAKRESDKKIAALQVEAANARLATEELHKKNLELAKAIQPRQIPWALADTVRRFAGTKAIVEVLPDAEATDTAVSLASTLRGGGWLVPDVIVRTDLKTALQDFGWPGIIISIPLPDFDRAWALPAVERKAYFDGYRRFREVATFLVKELNAIGIAAMPFAGDDSIPPDTVRIRISKKPVPGEKQMDRGNRIFVAPGTTLPPGFIKIEPDPPKTPELPKKKQDE